MIRVNRGSSYDVRYGDGEIDFNLKESSVRKFVPYEVGEVIQFSTMKVDFWEKGNILERDDENLIIKRYDGVILETHESRVRRYDWDWGVGDKVAALFRGTGTQWFRGSILAYHSDKDVFDILYDDGDIEYNVEADSIAYPWEKGFY